MNFELTNIPARPIKPRQSGITMVMDKGLSLREAENMVDACGQYIDYVKLGFGTSMVTNRVEEKIRFYQSNNIRCYLGGTLFEAFVIRNQFEQYQQLLDRFGVLAVEVSDGSMAMDHAEKCNYINILSNNRIVLSEVGSKVAGVEISNEAWVSMMNLELKSGSTKVIAEARESGNIGIYHTDGSADTELVSLIDKDVHGDNVIWEAPLKNQQVWFIKHFGSNVNLGNIAVNEVVSLETLRLGLRGDTMLSFLPEELTKGRNLL
ncbi:phosphosulfolactate synthase [Williamwhitmania taraxaci]|uniref:Phosphosulfolactate synthase n=1 Tax=Williamwhitmania taraxaci TaxID=1640674 RepID=A0A1G6HSZ0_9BACT|nr:phosphosulfolactate synthase [Williamwhitmania taraxaci]SDB97399.1 phosphosulfolactate synthase [Williamwhitmania taraxaci]